MAINQKEFTKRAALWYVHKYTLNQAKKNQHICICKNGLVFDIVCGHKYLDGIRLDRFIEVKGSCEYNPPTLRIFKSILDTNSMIGKKPINSDLYYVYLVYNIYINERPRLVILNSNFLRKYGKIDKQGNFKVYQLSKGIEENNIEIHKLSALTKSKKKIINSFHKRYKQHCNSDKLGLWVK